MYKGYALHESNGIKYPFKPRPYDDAHYYYASSIDGICWKIGYKGNTLRKADGTFESIVDILETLNENIKSKICIN